MLAELLAARIADADGPADAHAALARLDGRLRRAAHDEIDVYVDYSGTIWATLMQRTQLPRGSRARARRGHASSCATSTAIRGRRGARLREHLRARRCAPTHARELGIAAHQPARPARRAARDRRRLRVLPAPGVAALQRSYGLRLPAERSMDSSLMYQAVAQGEVDVITAFSTDGRIAAQDIALLEDDRGVIPPYDALVLVGPRAARERPAAARRAREPRRRDRRHPDASHEPGRRSGEPRPGRRRAGVPA